MTSLFTKNIGICHRCPFRGPANGACPCKVDGIDITIHADKGQCPKGYFAKGLPSLDCTHRGEQIAGQACASCSGKIITLKIFDCALHGQCGLSDRLTGVKLCGACPDRSENTAPNRDAEQE